MSTRSRVLALYHSILKVHGPLLCDRLLIPARSSQTAKALPSYNHRQFVLQRAKRDFRKDRSAPPERAEFLLQLGDSHLDTLRAQTGHMRDMFGTETLTHGALPFQEEPAQARFVLLSVPLWARVTPMLIFQCDAYAGVVAA